MRVLADELYGLMKPMVGIVPKKSFVPIVQGMRVIISDGQVIVMASDERVHLKSESTDIKVVGDGVLDVVMYPDAWAIIASMGVEEIEIGYEGDDESKMVIRGDRERYMVRVSPGAEALDFPAIPDGDEVIAKVMLTGRHVKRVYDSVYYACDEKQYWRGMGMICMDIGDSKLTAMAAGESYTAIEVLEEVGLIHKGDSERLFVIPEQMKMLMKVSDGDEALTMEFTDDVMVVYVGDGMVMVAPLPAERKFPPVHMIFKGIVTESEIVLVRAELMAMIEKLNNLSTAECFGLYLTNTGTTITMVLHDQMMGKVAEVELDGIGVMGSGVSRYININRLDEMVRSMMAQELGMRFMKLANGTEVVVVVNKDRPECLRMMAGLKTKPEGS